MILTLLLGPTTDRPLQRWETAVIASQALGLS